MLQKAPATSVALIYSFFLISLENFLDCFGNALFACPGLKRTESQDRNLFSFPGHAVHVERFIHSKKGGKY